MDQAPATDERWEVALIPLPLRHSTGSLLGTVEAVRQGRSSGTSGPTLTRPRAAATTVVRRERMRLLNVVTSSRRELAIGGHSSPSRRITSPFASGLRFARRSARSARRLRQPRLAKRRSRSRVTEGLAGTLSDPGSSKVATSRMGLKTEGTLVDLHDDGAWGARLLRRSARQLDRRRTGERCVPISVDHGGVERSAVETPRTSDRACPRSNRRTWSRRPSRSLRRTRCGIGPSRRRRTSRLGNWLPRGRG